MYTEENKLFTKTEILALRLRNDVSSVTQALNEKGIEITKQAISKWLLSPEATTAQEIQIRAEFTTLFLDREKAINERIKAIATARAKMAYWADPQPHAQQV
jgi:penicillin V acylase-like amidase (Ntn superfamily)